ncbi:hypothetical protein HPB50_014339 [Hyalomma asiaticum]|uniref:Uncharacterized protein n=1 Tax=Hyalomma asiaticum TaxID=266040 RepID=A0ACB7SF55_HYAAI|nr:hypothetical protein HPB50_014339 [Hyalomma asiaticum]
MGIYVTVSLDTEPLTAELFFPLGLPAGGTVDLIVAPPSQTKADSLKSSFSLCHALVCGRKVPIARNSSDESLEAASVPKGICVRSPLVNGQRICQLKNVRKGTSERLCPPSIGASTSRSAAPQTPLTPVHGVDTVVADNPEECKKALEDIIKAREPSTKTVFVCAECPHRTLDKEEAVEHCKSHLASSGTSDVARTAKPVPRSLAKRGRPPKERFYSSTCAKPFPSQQSQNLQTHLLNHTGRGAAVPSVIAPESANNIPPTIEPVKCSQYPVLETASDCPQPVSRALEEHADPSQGVTTPGDSSASEATLFKCLGSRQGIRAHTNIHKNLRPYECRKCGASLTSMTNLKAHMVCIHGNPGDNAKCPHCPKVFKLKRSLNIHVRAIHSQEGRRQCELCGKWLATERKLQRHTALTHYGDSVNTQDSTFSLLRPLKCDHCDFKSFSYPRLARHRVTHTGVYPHQCPECSKQFVFRDQMTRHVQTVHRKVRLTCSRCPRLFFSEKLFQQHLDAHRLGQGFPCTYVGLLFN